MAPLCARDNCAQRVEKTLNYGRCKHSTVRMRDAFGMMFPLHRIISDIDLSYSRPL